MRHTSKAIEGAKPILEQDWMTFYATKDLICMNCGLPWDVVLNNPKLECALNTAEPVLPSFADWLLKLHQDLTDLENVMKRLPYVDRRKYAEEDLPAIYAVQEIIEEITNRQPTPPPEQG